MALFKSVTNVLKGATYERKACRYLRRRGLRFITKNFRGFKGEIDLIMQDKECLVFVEVRYRKHYQRQSSIESIDEYKQQRLYQTAEYYLQTIKQPEQLCRFDIVGFDDQQIHWIKDAWQGN